MCANSPTFYNTTTKQTFLQRIVDHASTTTTMQTPQRSLKQKTNPNHKAPTHSTAFATTTIKRKSKRKITLVVKGFQKISPPL
jgi:hypothetical protein